MSESGPSAPRIRLTVELRTDTQPASGWIEGPDRERREFASVLELITLLEAARASATIRA